MFHMKALQQSAHKVAVYKSVDMKTNRKVCQRHERINDLNRPSIDLLGMLPNYIVLYAVCS